jgi:hypothetical protein
MLGWLLLLRLLMPAPSVHLLALPSEAPIPWKPEKPLA